MHYNGIVKGKVIEFEEPLPFVNGQPVQVSVQPRSDRPRAGTLEAVRWAMAQPPHLTKEDIEELNRSIEAGKLPVRDEDPFDRVR